MQIYTDDEGRHFRMPDNYREIEERLRKKHPNYPGEAIDAMIAAQHGRPVPKEHINGMGIEVNFYPVMQVAVERPYMFCLLEYLDELIRVIKFSIELHEDLEVMQHEEGDIMHHATELHLDDLQIILNRLLAIKSKMEDYNVRKRTETRTGRC